MLTHIFSRGRFGLKPGLERITTVLERLGNPHRQFKSVQIAGTNGKGSTGAFLSAIMTANGCKTAFFSSPHLAAFSERFRINDADIREELLQEAASRVLAVAPPEATFFEIVTAIAFCCFAAEEVELAIVETGMGGRWDATNVVDSLLSIITPVALDHCDYLGESLAAIAAEKAGIIKQRQPVVIAGQEPEALTTLLAAAESRNSRVLLAGRDFIAAKHVDGVSLQIAGGRQFAGLRLALQGDHQVGNAANAITAVELLQDFGFIVPDEVVHKGVAAARWPGRLELFPGAPPVLLDGAHNPAGAVALAKALAEFPHNRLFLVIGVMADKSWQEVVRTLLPFAAEVVAVKPALERALSPEELAGFCEQQGSKTFAAGSTVAGLEYVLQRAAAADLVLVAGSLFTVGEARAYLTGGQFMPIRG